MKLNFSTIAFLLLAFCITSCDKFVEPQASAIGGDLEGCFTLTGDKYQLTKADDGLEFTVTVSRTDQSVPYTAEIVSPLNANGSKDEYYLAGFGYTLYDKAGTVISEITPDKAQLNPDQVSKLLKLNKGETGELTIKVNNDLNPAKVSLNTAMVFKNSGKVVFNGSIGKYGIKNMEVEFDFAKKEINGKYQYTTSPAGAFLYWSGKIEEKELKQGDYVWTVNITENNRKGGWSGDLRGELQLTRDSNTEEYYFTLPGTFNNSHFDSFTTHLKSPVLSELYKEETSK